jgi:hypothetical protein
VQSGVGELVRRCARLIQDWRLLSKLEEGGRLSVAVKELERRSILSPRLSAPQLQ